MRRRRYEILLPVKHNDGRPVSPDKFQQTRDDLVARFEALSMSPLAVLGVWVHDGTQYEDELRRFTIDVQKLWDFAPPALVQRCLCGEIMAGLKSPTACSLFGKECLPNTPVGACMVSSEGTCRIWHQYGGHPDLRTAMAEVGR